MQLLPVAPQTRSWPDSTSVVWPWLSSERWRWRRSRSDAFTPSVWSRTPSSLRYCRAWPGDLHLTPPTPPKAALSLQLHKCFHSGPVLAVVLAGTGAVVRWKNMLGPRDVDRAKEESPDWCVIFFYFIFWDWACEKPNCNSSVSFSGLSPADKTNSGAEQVIAGQRPEWNWSELA